MLDVALAGDEHVAGFDIAVDEFARVAGVERRRDLRDELDRARRVER